MSYFLGIIPEENVVHKIKHIVGEVGRVFSGQEIDVRWSKSETYHITLLYLGDTLNLLNKARLMKHLKSFTDKQFEISFDKVSLGISRSYKELLYLSILNGGDELRDLNYKLKNLYPVEDASLFIPHVTIGRVNKDLTTEEVKNINMDLKKCNESLDLSQVSFFIKEIVLVEDSDNFSKILAKFPLS